MCPYFLREDKRFPCSFAASTGRSRRDDRQMDGVFIECKADTAHRRSISAQGIGPAAHA
jgi:hypothetical protein